MSELISLFELLNLAIGTPQRGAVDFSALHALLHAVLRQLDVRETEWRRRDGPGDQESRSPSTRTREDGADQNIQDLNQPRDNLKEMADIKKAIKEEIKEEMKKEMEEMKEEIKEEIKEKLFKAVSTEQAAAEPASDVEQCCHRVDALEEAVRSLRDALKRHPDPEDLSRCVTWDAMEFTLLSRREHRPKELVHSGVGCAATEVTSTEVTATEFTATEVTSTEVTATEVTATEVTSTEVTATEVTATAGIMQRYSETLVALRTLGQLDARVTVLEEGKADRSQLDRLTEHFTNESSRDASHTLMDQLDRQRDLIDGLLSDRDKLDSPEDMLLTRPDTEGPSGSAGSEGSYLRKCVKKLEEDVKQLKATQALCVERTSDGDLQDQLDDLRAVLEDSMQSLTSQLSEAVRDESAGSPDLAGGADGPALASSTVNTGRKLSLLYQHYEQLQDTVSGLPQQQSGGQAGWPDPENVQLVHGVQKTILQLQAECEKLHETTRSLTDDSRKRRSHIEELFKTTEELQEKKADKQLVESGMQADKSALESKVSRLQFDSVTEQLNGMFHELLSRVTDQEQDWSKVIGRLSTEMERKLNRMELDSVKKQLEDRWKNIQQKLQAQSAPEQEDAAGIRKQLVDRFHCLSCDRPVVMHTHGQHPVKLPSSAGFSPHKSIKPFTVYALEQFRQHYRSERVPEGADSSYLAMPRSCGGSHTLTSAIQRRSGLQSMKHHTQVEVDQVVQSEEVDIIGLDGHIYKGRLNASARNTETKLPTISTKDGKTKDKAKGSLPHKPSASPEGHPPHSGRSGQSSRSASSSSGRDWPVSALGCTSQSSITPASAAGSSAQLDL